MQDDSVPLANDQTHKCCKHITSLTEGQQMWTDPRGLSEVTSVGHNEDCNKATLGGSSVRSVEWVSRPCAPGSGVRCTHTCVSAETSLQARVFQAWNYDQKCMNLNILIYILLFLACQAEAGDSVGRALRLHSCHWPASGIPVARKHPLPLRSNKQ